MPEFQTAYGPRHRVVHDFSAETHGTNVKQSFKDEVDVNNVVVRFKATGVLPGGKEEPRYLDVSEMPSYREAMQRLRDVDSFFAALPAKVRDEFDNDPAAFLEFVSDPANAEEAERYGVADSTPDSGAPVGAPVSPGDGEEPPPAEG